MEIRVYNTLFGESPPQVYWAENLCDWLIEHYGEVPSVPFDLFVGEPEYSRCITGNVEATLNTLSDLFSIVERPAEPATAIQIWLAIVSIGVQMALAPSSGMPLNVNRSQQSANNGLGDRSNRERLYERVEDIYGEVLAIPSKMMPTYQYYDTVGDRFERGYYCPGRGYYDPTTAQATLRDGETLLADIPFCKASWYNPFTAPDLLSGTPLFTVGGGIFDPVDTRIEHNGVSGQVLRAPNEELLDGRFGYGFYGNKIVQAKDNPAFLDVFREGQTISVTMPYDVGSNANIEGYYYNIPAGSPIDGHADASGQFKGSANGIARSTLFVWPYMSSAGLLSWIFDTVRDAPIYYSASASAKTITLPDLATIPADTDGPYGGQVALSNLIVGDIIRGTFNSVGYRGKIVSIAIGSGNRVFTMDTSLADATNQVCMFGGYVNYTGEYTIASLGYATLGTANWLGTTMPELSTMTLTTSPFSRPVMSRYGTSFVDENWQLFNGAWFYTQAFINAVVMRTGVTAPDGFTSYIKMDNPLQTKIQINLASPQGIYKQSNSSPRKLSVSVTYRIQRLVDGVGTGAETDVVLVIQSNSNRTGDPTGSTLIVDLQATCGFVGQCQIKGRRTTPHDYDYQGQVIDEVQWEKLYAILPVNKTHFGNKSTVLTDVKLNQKALTINSRQLNVIAARLIPTWNGSVWSGAFDATGRHVSGTISKSQNPLEIIAAITQDRKIGNRPLTDIDVTQIAETIATINSWNTNCSKFSYTFDSDSISYAGHVDIIANAVFCEAYRQNSKVRLAFDGPQAASAALVTHRSKQPGAIDTVSRTFFDDSEYDGVQVIYPDPDTLKTETFYIPTSGNFTKAKKVEIPGIRNFTQAWMRGNREYNRIYSQREFLKTTMTMEARSFVPNLRIDIVDNTRFRTFSGEVVGINGVTRELTLSDDVVFKSGSTHSIVIARRNGSIEVISCTAGTLPNQVILSTLPSEALVIISGIDGIRTIYSFSTDDARQGMAYRVKRITYTEPPYVTLEVVNYSSLDYTADSLSVPSRFDVTNS